MIFLNHERTERITRQAFLMVVFAFGVLTLSTNVRANSILHFKGLTAFAFFSSLDAFVSTDVVVFASENRLHIPPGYSDNSAQLGMTISKFDNSTSTQLLQASGVVSLDNREFQIKGNLGSAKLNVNSVELFDSVAGIPINVDLSLVWTSTGTPTRQNDHFMLRQPGLKIITRFNGITSEAMASGTVSGLSSNFTPQPALFAQLMSLNQGQVTID